MLLSALVVAATMGACAGPPGQSQTDTPTVRPQPGADVLVVALDFHVEVLPAPTATPSTTLTAAASPTSASPPEAATASETSRPVEKGHDGVTAASASGAAGIEAILAAAGWPQALWHDAEAVAQCESHVHSDSANAAADSYGLFQLSPLWFSWAGVPFEQWSDPVANATVAWHVYHEYDGDSWRQWTCQP